ncbi:MAG: cytochrome P450 [Pseudonocardiaceae bacterium]
MDEVVASCVDAGPTLRSLRPSANKIATTAGEVWANDHHDSTSSAISSATPPIAPSTNSQQSAPWPPDMGSSSILEKLSFQSRMGGQPQHYFVFNPGDLYPVTLPASGKKVFVARDAKLVRLIMTDSRFSLARLNSREDTVTGTGYQSPSGMLRLDVPDIRRIRHGMISLFSEQNIAPWRQDVEKIADDLISKLLDGHPAPDLNRRYFEPFVVRAVALSAGITEDESDKLYGFSNRVLVRVENFEDRARICAAWSELYEYSGELIDKKLSDPDDRLLSRIFAELKKTCLSHDEIVATSGTILAGFYTPFGILSVCAVELFRHPDVVKVCQNEPTLWQLTVEELMRYKAHFNFFLPRVATEDITLGEVNICAGQVVLPSLHAAATDPNSFACPNVFHIDRNRARCNIVFGAGPHFCPGAALSRQWLQVGLERLFATLPGLRLAKPYSDLQWQPGSISMPDEVPVTWDRG